jgi:antitoxin component YwqK of YwqJK toxin-antitoxin module
MKKILALLFVVFINEVSTAQKHVVTYYDYSKIHPHEEYYVNAAGQKNGPYKEYTEDGVVVEESNYLNGLKNGSCVTYWVGDHNQRTVSGRGTYKNGDLNGLFTEYYRDGIPSTSGNYVNGMKEGKWTMVFPYENRRYGEAPEGFEYVRVVHDMKSNNIVTTGKVRAYYYPSGKLFREYEMKNGEDALKSEISYYPNGVLRMIYETDSVGNPVRKESYNPTGETIEHLAFSNGVSTVLAPSDTSWAFTANGDSTTQMKKSVYDYAGWKKATKPVPANK